MAQDVLPPEARAWTFFGLLLTCRWVVGFAVILLAVPLESLAMTFAPLSLLSPLAANGVIVSLVVGPCLLGEVVRPKEWVVALSILTCVMITIISGPKHSSGFALDSILRRCSDPLVL